MKVFSSRYRTYENWLASQGKLSEYHARIARLHALYPNANLPQLRGHPKLRSQSLQRSIPLPVHRRSWYSLSPREKSTRAKALNVLNEARRSGKPISELVGESQISIESVQKATRALTKVREKWVAKLSDRISRVMAINENGREVYVEVNSSKAASLIGKYHAAVRNYLYTADTSALYALRDKRFRDAKLKFHRFEIDTEILLEINQRREEPEFYEIYAEV
jgi:hypothetical protein